MKQFVISITNLYDCTTQLKQIEAEDLLEAFRRIYEDCYREHYPDEASTKHYSINRIKQACFDLEYVVDALEIE